jgi:D-alanyl-D-alanine carboxypeptidase
VVSAALFCPAVAADAAPDGSSGHSNHRATQRALDAHVEAGAPGAVARAQDSAGVWNGEAGVADLATGRERRPQDRYRIGSLTKTFVATVLLQLEAEGRIDLDDTVDSLLPGAVSGNGNNGHAVTVRQLLNHTSGIFDYTADAGFADKVFTEKILANRHDTWRPARLVALAMSHQPDFAPGTDWKYSNTNYILAGMIVEQVTGHSYATEIERRVLRPLNLDATTLPGTAVRLPRPSGPAYSVLATDRTRKIRDLTELNPSLAGSAGEMISDSADLIRFYSALLTGGLLPARQLREMMNTVSEATGKPVASGPGYGLGLSREKLSCGTEVWGHHGGIHGSKSGVGTTRDGKHSLAFNFNGDWTGDTTDVLEAEFCVNSAAL